MTEVDATDFDEQRLELLRRKLATHALGSQPTTGDTGLSDAQRRMWLVHSMDVIGSMLNVCVSYRITGDVELNRLHAAFDAVAARHSVLRTTYHVDADGEPRPVVHDDLTPGWAEHDVSELGPEAQRLRLEVLAQREFGTPFDLSVDAPLRITIARTGPAEHVILLTAHHIAWDDASWRIFFDDLTRAYQDGPAGRAAPPPAAPPVATDDHADLEYWCDVMVDPPEPLELPGPCGSAVPSSWRAARRTITLDPELLDAVTALARDTGATPYMVLLAAFSALLLRYTHAEDFLVAVPVLNRGGGDPGDDPIGYHGNTVALRMRPHRRQSFRDLIAAARDTAIGAFAHQRINLDRVVRELNPDRRYGVERMARVGFGVREPDGPGFCPPGVACERAHLRGQFAQLALGFMIELTDHGAEVEAEYLIEVINGALAHQLLDHFVVLLTDAVAHPDRPLGRLQVLSDDDANWLRKVSQGNPFDAPAATIGALVTECAARSPDAIAVAHEGRHYTYRELDQESNRLARYLISQGIGTEDRIAVLLDKSPQLVITALGVVKAGAVYVPVDPSYPEDRIAYILADAHPKLVLRQPVDDLYAYPDNELQPADLIRPLRAANTAYLIYTSGSTGAPKGVAVPHAPVTEYFRWFTEEYQVGPDDRLLQVAPSSFDFSIAEIFGTLSSGARLVIPRSDGLRDIDYLTGLLRGEAITSMHFVPSLLGLFLSLPGVSSWRTLRRVPIGGEALPGELADKFHATFDALLHNFYGPTEAVISATRYKIEGRQGTRVVPIGTPKINTTVYLLDDALQPVPVGTIGEIYIGGTHLAHGYHRMPDLTAERFIADPFNPGGRLYRSGDLGRRTADGNIEFVGRADEQVKIRGFRIELGEVAAAVAVDPSVGNAVVIAADIPGLGKNLVAYLTAAAGQVVDVDWIKLRVSAALPEYMTPAAYVVVDEIPITANGKLDRAALPEPHIEPATAYREPGTETERMVADLFARLLGRDGVGADDSFFDLGGHSLLATKLVAAVRSDCGVEVGVRDIFERGTVAELAVLIDELRSGGTHYSGPQLVALNADGPQPLSASQLRTWFQYRIDGPSPVNNIPFAARLRGPCDVDALVAAVGDIVERHHILRTTYREIDGVPYQVVEPLGGVVVQRHDGVGEQWLHDRLDAERGHRFNLEHERPVRAAVLSTPDQRVLSLVVHHIAADHWSAGVLFSDLLTAYRARLQGQAPSWPQLPVQYADYAAWQGALLGDPDARLVASQRDYWIRQLSGLPEDTGLRPDFPRPRVAGGAGASIPLRIDAGTRGRLTELSKSLGITEFMLLQAAAAVVLHKAGGGTDIPLGTPVAGRTHTELEGLVGFFVNILVLRNDLSDNPTLREVLMRAKQTALDAYAHQDLPFDRVVDAVRPVRSLSRSPLFQVVVHVRDELADERGIEIEDGGPGGDTTFTTLEPVFDVAHADLSLNFFAADDGYRGHVIYRTELYRASTMQRFVDWLHVVIDALATDPDLTLRDVALLDDVQRDRILTHWSRGTQPPPERPRTIPELLEPSRRFGDDRIAVRCGEQVLSYVALHRRSDRFAQRLARHGVGPGALVGLSMRRGIDLVVALVAIMKAGAGYFPVDPGYPLTRKQFMLDDVGPKVVLVTAEAGDAMPEVDGVTLMSMDDPALRAELDRLDHDPTPPSLPLPHPDDPMYLVFTSGSTGTPKGVLGTHRAMSARLDWQLLHYPLPGNDIRLAQASMTFLEGSMETLAGLAAGATMILADDAEHRDADALCGLVRQHQIAQVTAVASLVSTIVDSSPDVVRSLSRLVCSGEPVSASLLQRLIAAVPDDPEAPELLNNFGATETSGGLVRGPLAPPTPIIGKPTPGSAVYLLDAGLKPVPAGVVGELYYAGEQVVRGYWKRPSLTASRFVANPFAAEPGSRFYRSGDLARWTEDGRLEFLGRSDHQVKVRGFRVELGEVEAALKAADGVAVAAARTWDSPSGTSLAGYVVAHEPVDDAAAFAAAVRASITATLPGYMVPATITVLDAMPKTESGKLNRPGLPSPVVHTAAAGEPPRTVTERMLATAITDLLSVEDVARGDDFFALGGDSILSVQLAARLRATGLAVTARMIFEHPTLEALAAAIDTMAATESESDSDNEDDVHFAPMAASGLSGDELEALKESWSASRTP